MSEGSISVDGGSAFTMRLQRLRVFHKFHVAIGRVATSYDGVKTYLSVQSIRKIATSQANERDAETAPMPTEQLEEVLIKSNEILASATTVFPITLFPDTIVLDRTKLTVIRRSFILSEDVMSIRIEDILNVSATMGPFFGSLTIATRVLSSDDHFTIKHLWGHDALHLKHMIQGYVIARHNNIPCDHLSLIELTQTLRELGYEANRYHHLKAPFHTEDHTTVLHEQ